MSEVLCGQCGVTITEIIKPTKLQEFELCRNCQELSDKSDEFFKDVKDYIRKYRNG